MKYVNHILIFGFVFLFHVNGFAQFDIPEKPTKIEDQTSVYDYSNLLTATQKNNLENKLVKYSDSTSTQIVVAIVNTVNNDDISLVGAKWLHEWGIGTAKEDNGILVLLAKGDREIDINTGYGIEYRLSDIDAERIINRIIIPEFKKGNYYAGLDKGTDAIFAGLNGEFSGTRQSNPTEFPIGLIFFLIIVFIIFLIAISKNRRDGGHGGGPRGNSTAHDILEAIILSNSGRGGYRRSSGGFGGGWSGGSSSSGGGFSSGGFGGGSGGGGGASGSW